MILVVTAHTGGCLVILDPSMGLERANHCIKIAGPSAWLTPAGSWFKYLKFLAPALWGISIQIEVDSLATTKSASSGGQGDKVVLGSGRVVELVEPQDCVPVENALVTFTTGSTGLPKLMLRRHNFIRNQGRSMSHGYEKVMKERVGIPERDGVYCTNLPLFALHFITIGATCLVFPNLNKIQPAKILDDIKKYGVTFIGGSPAFTYKLACHAAKLGISLPVKATSVGGAPVYRGMLRTIASVTPEKKAMLLYGSTEVEPVSVIFADEKLQLEAGKPDGHCVGRPVFEDSARVISILSEPPKEPVDISTLEMPRGEIGEIVVSGWHVNTHQVEEKRLVRDVEGRVWLRIEDAGYMDREGRLWLVGRVKWRVERNGKAFWSTVVEQKVLDRCSVVTFAAYLPHKEEAWLFIEAPRGLPASEETGIREPLYHYISQSNSHRV
jgi:acyl-CoA synthetase (AMP-forming)/AMP-acid ligase II